MWKKLLVLIAVVGLVFAATPAMANGFGSSCAYALNLQAGAQGQGYYTSPGYTSYHGGQIGAMLNATGTSTRGNACALAVAGGMTSQSQGVSAPGFSAYQSQCAAGLSVSVSSSHSGRGGPR